MARRKKVKNWTSVFTDQKHPYFFIANDFFALLTIISILVIVLETIPNFSQYSTIFFWVEWITVALFSFEYIVRFIATKPSRKYALSFFGLIDLISILPSFLGIGNLTFLKSARALRIIRLLRLIRAGAVQSHAGDENYSPVVFNVLIYAAALLIALLTFGTLMYIAEPGEVFSSIPAGMWWSFKVFMAGIPVDSPVTEIGEILFVMTRFTGMLLLGLLLGVVGNIFRVVLGGKG